MVGTLSPRERLCTLAAGLSSQGTVTVDAIVEAAATPFKSEVLKALPNIYQNALKRTLSLRHTVSKSAEMKDSLVNNFTELIEQGWIVAEDDVDTKSAWYLPFFVTNQSKPRVVYDGASATEGASLN